MSQIKVAFAVGATVGHRTVLEGPVSRYVGGVCQQHGYYRVRCSCGTESWVRRAALESGKASGCKACRDDRQRAKTLREECS